MSSLLAPFDEPSARRLMVFGHPSHELALFGVLQELRPEIVLVTDGGDAEREAQAKEALASIGMLENTRFLHHPEDSFYRALLARDTTRFETVTEELRRVLDATEPSQVYCDATEFYNPVHDITLPLVRRALAGAPAALYEVPLVYQQAGNGQPRFAIQRIPEELAERRAVYELSEKQLDAKQHARDVVYRNLREQAGPEFLALSREHLAREEVALAGESLPAPGEHGRALRYDERARLLHERGEVEEAITYRDHFLPMLDALAAA